MHIWTADQIVSYYSLANLHFLGSQNMEVGKHF